MRRVLLVRHTEVARRWHGRCYGRSDMGLSREGARAARTLAQALATADVTAIVHSGLRRSALLAELIGDRLGIAPHGDGGWMERDFGRWEGQSWEAIWRQTGNAMDGMLADPDRFRPGGGETTTELIHRARRAWARLPSTGKVIVISHGGPIAAVRSVAAGASPPALTGYIPALGESFELHLDRISPVGVKS